MSPRGSHKTENLIVLFPNDAPPTLLLAIELGIGSDSVSTYFPAADSEQELHNIRLLLLLKLLDVLKGTHLDCILWTNNKLATANSFYCNMQRDNIWE